MDQNGSSNPGNRQSGNDSRRSNAPNAQDNETEASQGSIANTSSNDALQAILALLQSSQQSSGQQVQLPPSSALNSVPPQAQAMASPSVTTASVQTQSGSSAAGSDGSNLLQLLALLQKLPPEYARLVTDAVVGAQSNNTAGLGAVENDESTTARDSSTIGQSRDTATSNQGRDVSQQFATQDSIGTNQSTSRKTNTRNITNRQNRSVGETRFTTAESAGQNQEQAHSSANNDNTNLLSILLQSINNSSNKAHGENHSLAQTGIIQTFLLSQGQPQPQPQPQQSQNAQAAVNVPAIIAALILQQQQQQQQQVQQQQQQVQQLQNLAFLTQQQHQVLQPASPQSQNDALLQQLMLDLQAYPSANMLLQKQDDGKVGPNTSLTTAVDTIDSTDNTANNATSGRNLARSYQAATQGTVETPAQSSDDTSSSVAQGSASTTKVAHAQQSELMAHFRQALAAAQGVSDSTGTALASNWNQPATASVNTPSARKINLQANGVHEFAAQHGIDSISFPVKVFHMLLDVEEKSQSHIISFTPSGKALAIHNSQAFVKSVVRRYFNHNTIKSFKRQLYLHDFIRVIEGDCCDAFKHENFQRDRPELLKHFTKGGNVKPGKEGDSK